MVLVTSVVKLPGPFVAPYELNVSLGKAICRSSFRRSIAVSGPEVVVNHSFKV